MISRSANKATENLLKWMDRPEWAPLQSLVYGNHLLPVVEALGIPEEEIPETLGPGWAMLHIFILEDFLASRFGEEGEVNVIHDYLKRRGWRESVPGRRYLEALRDSVPSLYEVVALDPGRSMKVKDLLGDGGTMVVKEKRATEILGAWDHLAARVVSVNGSNYLTGGVLPFPREMSREFLKSIERAIREARKEIRRDLREACGKSERVPALPRAMVLDALPRAEMLSSFWAMETVVAESSPPPELQNTDGEPMLFCEVRFPLRGDMGAVAGVLDEIPALEGSCEGDVGEAVEAAEAAKKPESVMEWDWLAPGDPGYRSSQLRKGVALPDEITKNTEEEIGLTRLGHLVLDRKNLVLKVNSKGRAGRGQALLGPRLGDLVGRPMVSYSDPVKKMEDLDGASLSGGEGISIPDGDLERAVHAHLDRHYSRVLDEPLPVLGQKTPREAAKGGGKGRREAVDWLKGVENTEHRRARLQGHGAYDTGWIWKELGIRKPR